MTWSVSGTRSNSHSVAARSSCTNIPLASGEGSGGRDHSLRSACPSPSCVRFVHLDPPGLIRSREIAEKGAAACSGGLKDGSLDQNASCRILPERNHVVDNVAQAASDFVLILSCEELRLRGGRANAAGLKPSSRPGLARPVEDGGDHDPAAAQAWPTAQPRGGL